MVSFLPGSALMKTTVLESMRTLSYFRLDTLQLCDKTVPLFVKDVAANMYYIVSCKFTISIVKSMHDATGSW